MNYPENIKQQVRERAYEIYQYRQEFGMIFMVDKLGLVKEINAEDDWLQAETEVLGNLDLKK